MSIDVDASFSRTIKYLHVWVKCLIISKGTVSSLTSIIIGIIDSDIVVCEVFISDVSLPVFFFSFFFPLKEFILILFIALGTAVCQRGNLTHASHFQNSYLCMLMNLKQVLWIVYVSSFQTTKPLYTCSHLYICKVIMTKLVVSPFQSRKKKSLYFVPFFPFLYLHSYYVTSVLIWLFLYFLVFPYFISQMNYMVEKYGMFIDFAGLLPFQPEDEAYYSSSFCYYCIWYACTCI